MLKDGKPLPLPKAQYLAATFCVDKQGHYACIYGGFDISVHPHVLYVLDFDAGPVGAGVFAGVLDRSCDLLVACRAPNAVVFMPEDLRLHAEAAGLPSEPIPDDFEPELRLLSVRTTSRRVRSRSVLRLLKGRRRRPSAAHSTFARAKTQTTRFVLHWSR